MQSKCTAFYTSRTFLSVAELQFFSAPFTIFVQTLVKDLKISPANWQPLREKSSQQEPYFRHSISIKLSSVLSRRISIQRIKYSMFVMEIILLVWFKRNVRYHEPNVWFDKSTFWFERPNSLIDMAHRTFNSQDRTKCIFSKALSVFLFSSEDVWNACDHKKESHVHLGSPQLWNLDLLRHVMF